MKKVIAAGALALALIGGGAASAADISIHIGHPHHHWRCWWHHHHRVCRRW